MQAAQFYMVVFESRWVKDKFYNDLDDVFTATPVRGVRSLSFFVTLMSELVQTTRHGKEL